MANKIIQWSTSGNSFYISDKEAFIELLPHFFKTKNFNSFVRQLNMYGFHKVKGMNDQEFKHPFFRKGHSEYLCYIKRRYANTNSNIKMDAKESDISPSKYFDLRQQFNFLTEKVDNSTKEIERLNEENTKLHVICREVVLDSQKSLQKALVLLFSVLNNASPELSNSLKAYLQRLNIDLNQLMPLIRTVEIEHLIEQNILNKIFRTDNCRSIIDSLLGVLTKHFDQQKSTEETEKLKNLLLKQAYSEINQRLVVPTITHKLALNVMDEVVETCANSTVKKDERFEEFFQNN